MDETKVEENHSQEKTLRDDLNALEQLDYISALITRFRLGKHPDPELESLLARRMDLGSRSFQSPYLIRLVCTLAMVLSFCAIAWVIIWIACSQAHLNVFLMELSAAMVTFMIAMFVVAFFHPTKIFDERSMEKAGSDMIRHLRLEIAEIERKKPLDK